MHDRMDTARAAGAAAGEACQDKAVATTEFDAKGAAWFILRHLGRRGTTSSEILVEVCRIAGYRPHDDRAFGPVFARLVKAGQIVRVGECRRKRGNGTSGGNLWALPSASVTTNS